MTSGGHALASTRKATDGEIPTTAGILALANLQTQIDGQGWLARVGRLIVSERATFIELVALRGRVLGHIADYEWAEELAEQLTRDAPADGVAFMARAQARAIFHRFKDALTDLDEAQRLGTDSAVVDSERAAIFQAIGRYDEAFRFFLEAAERRAGFESLGALATLHAERGDVVAAERFFDESRNLYRGVSPFPLALFDFERGLMWMGQGDLNRARTWLSARPRRTKRSQSAGRHRFGRGHAGIQLWP
jgi:tetratricopeptide (TPR) repeat protein